MPDGSFDIDRQNAAASRPIEPTLADLLVAIDGDPSLTKAKRRAWCCSARRIASFMEREPSQLIARIGALRFGIERLHHASLGIARKTLQNHVANLKSAIQHFRKSTRLCGRGVAMSPAWQALHDRLPTKRLRLGLVSPFRYYSATGIAPEQANDAAVEAFIAYASEFQFTKKPKDLHKQVARCWNKAREIVPGWPQTRLTVPDFRAKPRSLAWDTFPPSFVADVERYLAQLGGSDLLDEDAPDRPCKPRTLKLRHNYLHLAASAAVKQGVEIASLRSLADLVASPVVKLILDHYIAQSHGKITIFTIDLADRLRSVARRYVKAPEADIAVLDRYCRKLGQHRRHGLTPKNMAVVRQLKDTETRRQLLALPGQLFDEALATRDSLIQAAVKAELAIAIFILLCAPMRLANLAALKLDQNVIRIGGKEPAWHIVIPDEDVKNSEALEYPLPKALNELLGAYLALFRPRLCREDNPWLFPGMTADFKTKGTLSGQIIEVISKRLGIRITPHQFRHVAAAIILEKYPANYEFVRRVLGHKRLETTIRFYVGLETIEAVRKYSALVLEDAA